MYLGGDKTEAMNEVFGYLEMSLSTSIQEQIRTLVAHSIS